jgi:hypothetical protein
MTANLRKVVCDDMNIQCIERKCNECAGRLAHEVNAVAVPVIKYYQWERITDGKGFQSTKCLEVTVDK